MTSESTGLFGGSFNPPHVCHVLASVWALETQPVEEVWWIPAYEHAFGKALEAFAHRLEMCERATARRPSVRLCEIEHEQELSHTIDTVRALERRHPRRDFSLIVGSDILEERDEWKQWERLMERVELIVVGRSGYGPSGGTDDPEFELPNVSSTRLRRALGAENEPWIDAWLPDAVHDYIREHGLYGLGD